MYPLNYPVSHDRSQAGVKADLNGWTLRHFGCQSRLGLKSGGGYDEMDLFRKLGQEEGFFQFVLQST